MAKQLSLREDGHCECGEELHAIPDKYGIINIECSDCGTSRRPVTVEDFQIVDAAAEAYWEKRWSN